MFSHVAYVNGFGGHFAGFVGRLGEEQTGPDLEPQDLWQAFMNWLHQGELKRTATRKAEDYVKMFYGLEGGCAIPQPGLPIEPRSGPPYTFCDTSIAGMIERCQLVGATKTIEFLELQIRELADDDAFFARWAEEYGYNDIRFLKGKLSAAQSACGYKSIVSPWLLAPPTVPQPCPTGSTYNSLTRQCVTPSGTAVPPVQTMGAGGIPSEMLWLGGGLGIVGLMFALSGKRR